MRSALLPAGVLVGFAWIIGIALATRGDHRHDRNHELHDLADRMCACKDALCIAEVAQVGPPSQPAMPSYAPAKGGAFAGGNQSTPSAAPPGTMPGTMMSPFSTKAAQSGIASAPAGSPYARAPSSPGAPQPSPYGAPNAPGARPVTTYGAPVAGQPASPYGAPNAMGTQPAAPYGAPSAVG